MINDTQSPADANAEPTADDADETGLPITRRYYLTLAAAVGGMKSTDTVGAASVAGISPYYNLAPDPTSESLIYWIDERDSADSGEQTFEFGTSPDSLTQQETATSDAVPEKNGIYRYSADLSGRDEGATYYGESIDEIPARFRSGHIDQFTLRPKDRGRVRGTRSSRNDGWAQGDLAGGVLGCAADDWRGSPADPPAG